ncbi:MAG: hypothetical protein A3C71_00530 [Candidatus Yanofskybacteria bacterium RIFCSPHIGHO2_02_FULL_43_15c]|uniref:Uncharacterized protein n=1 Tax=Candidatus Yanofskybacteria bacterium RIFCSPHIGHO2_02_FULL_43_15c TaxID=1802679 RepID=A0A1F8FKZ0_9BACT|nr:MAG: hypothetical protein A3C71_00530 [Candidatus Yanofskybacteria bacterium RIFCSPHIGHO2_02_FULL_43_15c]
MKGLYAQLENIENLAKLAEENIEALEESIIISQKKLKVWQNLLTFSQTCRRLVDEEATESKKGQLHYKWTKVNVGGSKVWTSEAGNVSLKAWGKYQGFPKGLERLHPFADDDRSANHMAHRPKRDQFDSDTTDFDTLVDCQLAVEKAHEYWQKKNKK